jgi:hypothetical protein
MTDIHTCSYYCDKPECIKAQRDELRDKLTKLEHENGICQACVGGQCTVKTGCVAISNPSQGANK